MRISRTDRYFGRTSLAPGCRLPTLYSLLRGASYSAVIRSTIAFCFLYILYNDAGSLLISFFYPFPPSPSFQTRNRRFGATFQSSDEREKCSAPASTPDPGPAQRPISLLFTNAFGASPSKWTLAPSHSKLLKIQVSTSASDSSRAVISTIGAVSPSDRIAIALLPDTL